MRRRLPRPMTTTKRIERLRGVDTRRRLPTLHDHPQAQNIEIEWRRLLNAPLVPMYVYSIYIYIVGLFWLSCGPYGLTE